MKQQQFETELAKAIKALRTLRGAKQIVLAQALNIKPSDYSKLENGKKHFKANELYLVASLLSASVNQLFALAQLSAHIANGSHAEVDLLQYFAEVQQQQAHSLLLSNEELKGVLRLLK